MMGAKSPRLRPSDRLADRHLGQQLTIALDTMGGDQAPDMVLKGAEQALIRFPQLHFLLFGSQDKVLPLLDQLPRLKAAATFIHAEDVVSAEAKPSAALRSGKRTSMRLMIDAVADGRASCAVSAGNTGALMAMAKVVLKTLPGIDRPAIASILPTSRGETVMLDLGANVECDADNLVQFALMGDAFARTALGLTNPSIAILNVGLEEAKGLDSVREAAARLRDGKLGLNFIGFVEGNDITSGTADVVVTDGFAGNIALKTAEGVVKMYGGFLRSAFKHSLSARIGYIFARSALKRLRERVDPRRYNGAMLVGLNGIVVKSHGGSDALGFANAIGVAADLGLYGFLDRIREELAQLRTFTPEVSTPAASQAAAS